MIALQIQDIKIFMNKLLLDTSFDAFLLKEAEFTTGITHTIDGSLHRDFFDSDEELPDIYAAWRDVKPYALSVIKGKRPPLHFHLVFRLNNSNTCKLLQGSGLSFDPEQVSGLYLNCSFDGTRLTCTSGSALSFFTLDKSLDHVWDDMLRKFFRQQQIPFTLM